MFPVPEGPVLLQYKSKRSLPSSYSEFQFVGLDRQTVLDTESRRQIWTLRFSDLSTEETARIRNVFETNPPLQQMEFSDPWTGITFAEVKFGPDGLRITQVGPSSFDIQFELEGIL